MTQKGFYIDVSRCTGCRTCSVACADKNGAWRQDVFAYYVSIGCNECADPACVKACPTKAHMKRAEDGLVVIDESKCIGCGLCAKACPYGVPQLNTKKRKMTK